MAYKTYDKDGTQRPSYDEENGVYKYTNIGYTVKASEE